jgi:hypothetical protein
VVNVAINPQNREHMMRLAMRERRRCTFYTFSGKVIPGAEFWDHPNCVKAIDMPDDMLASWEPQPVAVAPPPPPMVAASGDPSGKFLILYIILGIIMLPTLPIWVALCVVVYPFVLLGGLIAGVSRKA